MIRVKTLLNFLAYGVFVLAAAPLFPHLDRPVQALLPILLGVAVLCDRKGRYPLASAPATVLSFALFLFYLLQIRSDHFVEPMVNVLALLMALRLATEKSGRHHLQIFVLSLFALAASSLLTLGAGFFVYLVLLVVLVTVGLVLLSFHTVGRDQVFTRKALRQVLAAALALPAGALMLMLFFFLLLPRTRYPLWGFLNTPAAATTGLSETVSPGSASSTVPLKEVAFRAETLQIPGEELYWRGIVLNAMEKGTWVRHQDAPFEKALLRGGKPIVQTLYPEPGRLRYLPALDTPRDLDGIRARRAPDQVFLLSGAPDTRLRYRADSAFGGRLEILDLPDRAFYLQVPPDVSPKLRQAASDIHRGAPGVEEKIVRLEDFYRSLNLAYATSGLPGGPDPMESFLFQERKGSCEYFASSFALMLRLLEVPSRLVGGYYGGDYNDLGGYYIVTEDLAHVWVEALVGKRWVRLDPSRLAYNAAPALLDPRARGLPPGRRLLDAVDYFWTQAVITYDLDKQLRLARDIRLPPMNWGKILNRTMLPAIPLAIFAAAAVLLLFLRRPFLSREEHLLQAFLRRVRRNYRLDPPPSMGLLELAERTGDPLCRDFAEVYGGALFRDRRLERGEQAYLRKILRRMGKGRGPRL